MVSAIEIKGASCMMIMSLCSSQVKLDVQLDLRHHFISQVELQTCEISPQIFNGTAYRLSFHINQYTPFYVALSMSIPFMLLAASIFTNGFLEFPLRMVVSS